MSHEPLLVSDPFVQSQLEAIEAQVRQLPNIAEKLVGRGAKKGPCRTFEYRVGDLREENRIADNGGTIYSVDFTSHDHQERSCSPSILPPLLRVTSSTHTKQGLDRSNRYAEIDLTGWSEGFIGAQWRTGEDRHAQEATIAHPFGVATYILAKQHEDYRIEQLNREGFDFAIEFAQKIIEAIRTQH